MVLCVELAEGQTWRTIVELSTRGTIHWRAPFSSAFDCVIPAGTDLVILHAPPPSAIGVYCRPVDYGELEKLLVPREDREAEKYDGYSLSMLIADFDQGKLVRLETPG